MGAAGQNLLTNTNSPALPQTNPTGLPMQGVVVESIFRNTALPVVQEQFVKAVMGEEFPYFISVPGTQQTVLYGFKYQHNPSENPKVLKDAFEDPSAIYGYRPKKEGGLSAFYNDNWSDPQYVEYARQNRIDYHNRNEAVVMKLVSEMRTRGCTDEQIARAVVEFRNESRLSAYMDDDGNIINQAGYNQALSHSKTYEDLIHSGKTNEDIIKSATRGNPAMDACTGLYDDYYDTYSGGK